MEGAVSVGSSASDVEASLGAPTQREASEVHGKFVIPALEYDGIRFVLEDGEVSAIIVGR